MINQINISYIDEEFARLMNVNSSIMIVHEFSSTNTQFTKKILNYGSPLVLGETNILSGGRQKRSCFCV